MVEINKKLKLNFFSKNLETNRVNWGRGDGRNKQKKKN